MSACPALEPPHHTPSAPSQSHGLVVEFNAIKYFIHFLGENDAGSGKALLTPLKKEERKETASRDEG